MPKYEYCWHQRQTEEQADHEQEHEPMNGHTKLRRLKWGVGRARFRSKDKASRECCQARGTKVRIIHYREGQYHSLQTGGFQVELRYLERSLRNGGRKEANRWEHLTRKNRFRLMTRVTAPFGAIAN